MRRFLREGINPRVAHARGDVRGQSVKERCESVTKPPGSGLSQSPCHRCPSVRG
jgi:hypothetical protein